MRSRYIECQEYITPGYTDSVLRHGVLPHHMPSHCRCIHIVGMLHAGVDVWYRFPDHTHHQQQLPHDVDRDGISWYDTS